MTARVAVLDDTGEFLAPCDRSYALRQVALGHLVTADDGTFRTKPGATALRPKVQQPYGRFAKEAK